MYKYFTILLILFFSLDAHSQWKYSGNPYGVGYQRTQCFASNGTNLFAGTLGLGVWLSTDNGETYKAVNEGLTNKNVTNLLYANSTLIASTEDGIFVSTNNGTNWMAFNTGLDTKIIYTIYQPATGSTFLLGTMTGLFIFNPNQMSWQLISQELAGVGVNSIILHKGILYITTLTKGLMKSTNNGQNWTEINTGLPGKNTDIITSAGNNLYVSYRNQTETDLYSSSDFGKSWTKMSPGLPISSGSKCFLTVNDVLVVGNYNTGIYYTKDNGTTWTAMNEGFGTSRTVRNLYFYNNNIYCAIFDGVNYIRKSSDLVTDVLEDKTIDKLIYPNPAVNNVKIELTSNSSDINLIELTDISGKVILQKEQFLLAGKNIIDLDLENINSGKYFISIKNSKSIINQNIIIQK